jgi:hypothetical protein
MSPLVGRAEGDRATRENGGEGAGRAARSDGCRGAAVTRAQRPTAITGSFIGAELGEVTIGADGLGVISLTSGELFVDRCADIPCSAVTTTDVGARQVMGHLGPTSITIGADFPLIGYANPGGLQIAAVAHCGNALCVPYSRRR